MDLDNEYGFGDIKSVAFYQGKFYILANKMNRKIGYFLLELDEDLFGGPSSSKCKTIVKWVHKLNIGDGSIDFMTNNDNEGKTKFQMVVGFKTVYCN